MGYQRNSVEFKGSLQGPYESFWRSFKMFRDVTGGFTELHGALNSKDLCISVYSKDIWWSLWRRGYLR